MYNNDSKSCLMDEVKLSPIKFFQKDYEKKYKLRLTLNHKSAFCHIMFIMTDVFLLIMIMNIMKKNLLVIIMTNRMMILKIANKHMFSRLNNLKELYFL